jgi:signal transduction histidine kinase
MLGEFVRQAISAAVARERDVPIIHNNGTNELFVELDKRRIAQVIRNLSENADKYAGGVTQIRLERTDDDVRIEIEDEGPGVPIDERELIFERFARGSEGGRRGSGTGVGLGLSLVTEHLRLQGGTISVTDRVDGLLGSRFVISLPGVVVQ